MAVFTGEHGLSFKLFVRGLPSTETTSVPGAFWWGTVRAAWWSSISSTLRKSSKIPTSSLELTLELPFFEKQGENTHMTRCNQSVPQTWHNSSAYFSIIQLLGYYSFTSRPKRQPQVLQHPGLPRFDSGLPRSGRPDAVAHETHLRSLESLFPVPTVQKINRVRYFRTVKGSQTESHSSAFLLTTSYSCMSPPSTSSPRSTSLLFSTNRRSMTAPIRLEALRGHREAHVEVDRHHAAAPRQAGGAQGPRVTDHLLGPHAHPRVTRKRHA